MPHTANAAPHSDGDGAPGSVGGAPAKPAVLRPEFDNMPAELRDRPRWVLWRLEWDADREKHTKVPYRADGRGKASSTNSDTWTTFDAARAAYERGTQKADGVGWVIGDGIAGVDIDACRDLTKLTTEAAAAVAELNTYTEVSPSGTGVRAFAFGTLPSGRRKRGPFEMYDGDHGRYLTVTGHRLPATPATVNERTAALATVHARHLAEPPRAPSKQPEKRSAPAGKGVHLSDAEVIERMTRKKPDAARLWAGDLSDYTDPETGKPDHSRADAGLAAYLAWWTDYNEAQVHRLMATWCCYRAEKWARVGADTLTLVFDGKGPGDGYRPGTRPLAPQDDREGDPRGDQHRDATGDREAPQKRTQRAPAPKRTIPPLMTAAELLALELPPLNPVVADLIVPGLNVFAGPYKLGKSWLALQMAHQVATGGNLFNRPTSQGRVMYYALEDGQRRLQARLNHQGITPLDNLMLGYQLPRMDAGGVDYLAQQIDRYNDTRLVIIDSFARFKPTKHNGNSNAYDVDSQLGDTLQRLALERDVALVLITHLRKMPADDVFDTITGSVGIPGVADALIVLKRKRGEQDGVLHVTSRDFEEREDALRFDRETGTWHMLGNAAEYAMTKQRRLVLEAVRALGVASPSNVAEYLGEQVTLNSVRVNMQRMASAGELRQIDRGKYMVP